eukprot:scaffold29678_cov57-Phaeocystis_antarctica.AAC.3
MSWPVLEITKAGAALVGAPARAIVGAAGAGDGMAGCGGGGPSAGSCDGSMSSGYPQRLARCRCLRRGRREVCAPAVGAIHRIASSRCCGARLES